VTFKQRGEWVGLEFNGSGRQTPFGAVKTSTLSLLNPVEIR